jgi:hypothetical protein
VRFLRREASECAVDTAQSIPDLLNAGHGSGKSEGFVGVAVIDAEWKRFAGLIFPDQAIFWGAAVTHALAGRAGCIPLDGC